MKIIFRTGRFLWIEGYKIDNRGGRYEKSIIYFKFVVGFCLYEL